MQKPRWTITLSREGYTLLCLFNILMGAGMGACVVMLILGC